jgi:hypothetical protein
MYVATLLSSRENGESTRFKTLMVVCGAKLDGDDQRPLGRVSRVVCDAERG